MSSATLWGIVQIFLGNGNRYLEIASYNGMANTNIISLGQVIKKPNGQAPAPSNELKNAVQ